MPKKKKDKFGLIHKLKSQLKRDFPKPFCIYAGWQLLDLICEYKSNPDDLQDTATFYINPVVYEGFVFTNKPDEIDDPEGNMNFEMLTDIHNYYQMFDDFSIVFYIYNDHFIRFNLDNISV